MPITIGSNIASLQAQRRLGESSNALSSVFERLSSGQRINRASDDAAGLAIADSLNADARVLGQRGGIGTMPSKRPVNISNKAKRYGQGAKSIAGSNITATNPVMVVVGLRMWTPISSIVPAAVSITQANQLAFW